MISTKYIFFRIQEALMEQNKLQKQLENFKCELQLQKNELTNSRAEKLKLINVCLRFVSKISYNSSPILILL